MNGRPTRDVMYPRLYTWLVFLGALDIILTWVVLGFGGSEANALAEGVLERWGLAGMIVLKVASMVAVVLIGEFIGRRQPGTGRVVLLIAVIVTAAPVMLAFALLVRFVFGHESAENFERLILT